MDDDTKLEVEPGLTVRIINYCGTTDNHYVGRLGEVVELFFKRGELMILVKLHDDPNPVLATFLGGLPCLPHEIEVFDGNPTSN